MTVIDWLRKAALFTPFTAVVRNDADTSRQERLWTITKRLQQRAQQPCLPPVRWLRRNSFIRTATEATGGRRSTKRRRRRCKVRAALSLGGIILSAAGLGFLGMGVAPPTAEWGSMVAEGSKVIFDQWWVAAAPGGAILFASLAFNLLGDGLRDKMDPRHGH